MKLRLLIILLTCFCLNNLEAQTYPLYEIGDVTSLDSSGEPDSINVDCEIRGIVYGVNLRPNGLQFTLIDNTNPNDGISTLVGNGNWGYTVNEGDELACQGQISHFNGLAQMFLDSVYLISTGNTLHDPETITGPVNEAAESKLIKIFNLTFPSPGQWSPSGSGFNVNATDGTNTYQIRIDNDVDLFSQSIPNQPFNITAIGSQFDSNSPFNSGYQILPRYAADIEDYVPPVSADEINFEEQVQLYPNPASDVLFVTSELMLDKIYLHNLLGQKVMDFTPDANNSQISVKALSSGLYIMTYEKDGHSWSEEWLKN